MADTLTPQQQTGVRNLFSGLFPYSAINPTPSRATVFNPYATVAAASSPPISSTGYDIVLEGDTPSSDMSKVDFNALVNRVMEPPAQAKSVPINVDPSWFQIPTSADMNQYLQAAFSDPSLIAYYTKVLEDAQGDYNRAVTRLKEDYTKGLRYSSEDIARLSQKERENLTSALETLGVTFTGERESLIDTLNKRGMLVTQKEAGPGTGDLAVGTQGRGGVESARLSEDQQLRQEAVQRTADRNLTNLGIKGQRDVETARQDLTRGTEDYTRQLQQIQTSQLRAKELEAKGIAEKKASDVMSQKGLSLQQAQVEAQNQSAGLPSSSPPSVNPDDVGSIKAAFPGYAGWNDPNAIKADYRATQGAGKR